MKFFAVDGCLASGLPNFCGIYWLVALDGALPAFGLHPSTRTIVRLTGSDPAGILYIGSTENATFRKRPGKLVEMLNNCDYTTPWTRLSGYTAIYSYLHSTHVARTFPVERLAVVLEAAPTADAVRLEGKYLYNYRQEFGELPPFNRSFPRGIDALAGPAQVGPLIFEDRAYAPWHPAPVCRGIG